jgi:hypothetical protein
MRVVTVAVRVVVDSAMDKYGEDEKKSRRTRDGGGGKRDSLANTARSTS